MNWNLLRKVISKKFSDIACSPSTASLSHLCSVELTSLVISSTRRKNAALGRRYPPSAWYFSTSIEAMSPRWNLPACWLVLCSLRPAALGGGTGSSPNLDFPGSTLPQLPPPFFPKSPRFFPFSGGSDAIIEGGTSVAFS